MQFKVVVPRQADVSRMASEERKEQMQADSRSKDRAIDNHQMVAADNHQSARRNGQRQRKGDLCKM